MDVTRPPRPCHRPIAARRAAATTALALLIAAGPWGAAWAQRAGDTLQVRSLVQTGVWSSSRDLDDETGLTPVLAQARVRWKAYDTTRAVVEVQAWNRDFGAGPAALRVREGYVEYEGETVDLRAGRQVIAWGRGDRLNPTDFFGARSHTLLTPEDEEQRLGIDALQVRWRHGAARLTWLLEPDFRPTLIPVPAQPGLTTRVDEDASRSTAYGLKLDHEGGRIDASISWYRGPDRNPDPTPVSLAPGALVLQMTHHPVDAVGLDFATVLGSVGLRGELAYTTPRHGDPEDPFRRKRFVYGVLGVEHSFAGGDSVQLQVFHKHVFDHVDPASLPDPRLRALAVAAAATMDQRDADRVGATLRWARRWLNDALQAEVAVLVAAPRSEWALRPRLRYQLGDHWTLIGGLDVLRGDADSLLGRLRRNSAGFMMLQHTR